jgi:hypothetical protein
MMRAWTVLFLLLFCVGCGDATVENPPSEDVTSDIDGGSPGDAAQDTGTSAKCEAGEEQVTACGFNGNGVIKAFCVEGAWGEPGPCSDPDACENGSEQTEACGLNGKGAQTSTCADGKWGDASECDDPDVCENGAEKSEACGLNGNGTQVATCAEGQWGDFAPCLDPDECTNGGQNVEDCGTNGTMEITCTEGQWVSGECKEAGTPQDYVFSTTASVVTGLTLATVDGAPECCFDLNGDGKGNDNKLGQVIDALAPLLGEEVGVNAELAASIESGSISYLFEYVGLSGLQGFLDDTPPFTINIFSGQDTDDDYSDNLAGTGSYFAELDSFSPGTGNPLSYFPNVTITDGQMKAGPGKLNLAFNLGTIVFDVVISETMLEASVEPGPNPDGIAFTNGKLGGVLTMKDFYAALNTYADTECSCLNVETELITYMEITGKGLCNDTSASTCANDSVCKQVGDSCFALLLLINPDVDIDMDGILDGMSIGIWMDGTSTTIQGLEPEK